LAQRSNGKTLGESVISSSRYTDGFAEVWSV
jgi:hypothetical protein